jgi:hypothetical protein
MLLLDTDVMIDVLRGNQAAVAWLAGLGDEELGLPGFVVMELLDGCTSKLEMNRLQRQLEPFRVYWPSEADCNRALADFLRSHLSQGVGWLDVLIGEYAVGLGSPLCTFNVKHFKSIPDLVTEQPYSKQ